MKMQGSSPPGRKGDLLLGSPLFCPEKKEAVWEKSHRELTGGKKRVGLDWQSLHEQKKSRVARGSCPFETS